MTLYAKTYSVGELAKATGLTVRTLQHYDNIGLLPPSGRTEGGRRYYTDDDMMKLTRIAFYKAVGIPLSDIREELSDAISPHELEAVFNRQLTVVLMKMNALNAVFSVLNSSLALLHSGSMPSFETLAQLVHAMEASGLSDWANSDFSLALNTALEGDAMATLDGAMHFYHNMRTLMVEAIALDNASAAMDSPAALNLGKRWWEDVIQRITAIGDSAASAALAVNNSRDKWPDADRKLFEVAEPFLEAASDAYLKKINAPEIGGGIR